VIVPIIIESPADFEMGSNRTGSVGQDIDRSGSRDVIDYAMIQFLIGHFLMVVL